MCRRSYRGNRRGSLSRKSQNWQPRGIAWDVALPSLFLHSVSHLTFAPGSRGYEGASHQTEGVVEKRDIVGKWSPEDWREFDRWIRANAVIGSLLAAGLLVMAVAGAPSAGPGDAAQAADSKGSGLAVSVQSRLTPAP